MNIDNYFGLAVAIITILVIAFVLRQKLSTSKSANPLGEAEVYIAYKRYDEAKKILEQYLLENPGDQKATQLLEKIRK